MVTYEDHIASVVRPRLEAAGAELGHVHAIGIKEADGTEGLLTLPDDIELIRQAIERTGARLLTVDPIVASLSGEINSHRDQDIRRVLAPLAQLAEQYDVAAIIVMHVNKSQAKELMRRVGGSVGFSGAARSILLLGRDPNDPDGERGPRRVLAHGKCNVGPEMPSLLLEIESVQLGELNTSRLRWLGESETTIAELLGGDDGERTDTELAGEWLADELADRKWHESRGVKERAKLGEHQRTNAAARQEGARDRGSPRRLPGRLGVASASRVNPVAPGSPGGTWRDCKSPVAIDDQLGLVSQSRHVFEVGATGD